MRIEEYKDMISACGRGNYCKGIDFNDRCPEIFTQVWESSTARGRMAIARGILEGKLDYSEELAERIFGCFMCARCQEECKKAAQIDVIAITKAMRADFVDRGIKIPAGGEQMVETTLSSGNIFADTPSVHNQWTEGLEFTTGSGTLFYPGCLASHRFKEKTNILVRLLQAAGYVLDFLGDEQTCCGTPFWVTGKVENAKQWAEDYLKKLQARGVKEIITPCPSCFRAFDEEYPELLGLEKFTITVRHTSAVLEEIVEKKKLRFTVPIDKKVTYHDPCELGRYRDIYDPARKIFEALPGVEYIEMARNKENAFCCGGGGAVKTMFEDHSDTVAKERIQEFSSTGADLMTTICPACELNLTQGTYMVNIEARVLDVAELMAVSAGIVDPEILDSDYFPED
ncbi:MAG: (Fe-S)-binding protein [Candidatus Thorarchaeota archaeon]|nr:MAG: (Fe-S)-binding protein [Candidatus Thorarchaeota archaeon]